MFSCLYPKSRWLALCNFFLFSQLKISLRGKIGGWVGYQTNVMVKFNTQSKRVFRGASINENLTGISVLKMKGTILNFFRGKCSFIHDTFWTQLIFWRKLTFHLLLITFLVNTASVSLRFEHSSYFEENYCFIHCWFLSW